MYKNNSKTLLSVAVASALLGQSYQVLAQEPTSPEDTEIIEVTGFRSSLIKGRDLKRSSAVSQDTIVAEDIAAFPDLNLAESLQRVSGVTITREGGEGRQISLRGLGPDFTRVEVNGMEALGTSATTLDAKDAFNKRSFDFNVFASELFSQLDVKKSYSADTEEGGIGGTVGLRTAKPFDYDGFTAVVSGQAGTNTNTDSFDPRTAFLISNTWNNFGALVSVAYSKRENEEYGINTTRWRKRADATAAAGIADPTLASQVENGDIWFPRGIRNSSWFGDQERLGVTASVQYRPSDDFSLTFDALYGKLESDKSEHHLVNTYSLPSNHDITALTLETVNGDGPTTDAGGDIQMVSGTFVANDQSLRTETRRDLDDSEFKNFVLSGDWYINDDLSMSFLVGTATSTFDRPQSDKAYLQNRADATPIEFTIDCSSFECTREFASFDPTNPDNWEFRELRFEEKYIDNSFDNIQIDFEYALTDETTLTFGINSKKFENKVTSLRIDKSSQLTELSSSYLSDNTIGSGGVAVTPFSQQGGMSWLLADLDSAQSYYGLSNLNLLQLRDSGYADTINSRSVPDGKTEEDTFAYYAQVNFGFDVGDMFLRGNAGARHYSTDATGRSGDIVEEISYSGTLPAINLALEINDAMIVRASAGKNISRQPLSALTPTNAIRGDQNMDIRGGAPNLKHMESTDLEASFEWYFEENVGYFAVAYYQKTIDDFITEFSRPVVFSDTGLDPALLEGILDENGNQTTANSVFDLEGTINIDEAEFSGIEFSLERDFDFLPGTLKNAGIRASYTMSDGDTVYPNVQSSGNDSKKNFIGLSESSYNVTVYYETEVWGARISQTYRDDYITRVEVGLADEDERGFHGSTFVDFAGFYNVSEDLKITLKANNLTNEKEELYSDSSDRMYAVLQNGRNFYLGATYQF
ncbi:TonB-dependent receptor [Aestuariibacter sp. A3R04]|uniref:TonB-dependent receptor n=1 Tax=Aestuariibacter sp. A3R04 TaxID=2841571 RepID=UPI001C09A926|nr:TonB-dependent receptor [Aestuariibacter sp. A3R04]MBU3022864.1 TonB-dependent receptor [Aestuariibacter sp. A3R04]